MTCMRHLMGERGYCCRNVADSSSLLVSGALGAERFHWGRITAGESQKRCGHFARRSAGAHRTKTPGQTPPSVHPPDTVYMVLSHQGKTSQKIFQELNQCRLQFTVCEFQGRFDALLALLRRQYDRVAIMRPTPQDQVRIICRVRLNLTQSWLA